MIYPVGLQVYPGLQESCGTEATSITIYRGPCLLHYQSISTCLLINLYKACYEVI